ncbi:hypothetical protein ACQAYK_03885 [Acidithiobacillus sp. AC3]
MRESRPPGSVRRALSNGQSLRHRVATVRWRFFQTPARMIRNAGTWVLKISTFCHEFFTAVRAHSATTALDPSS